MANAGVVKVPLRRVTVTCDSFTKKHLASGGLGFCLPKPPREVTPRSSLSCFSAEDIIWGQRWHVLWVPSARPGAAGWGLQGEGHRAGAGRLSGVGTLASMTGCVGRVIAFLGFGARQNENKARKEKAVGCFTNAKTFGVLRHCLVHLLQPRAQSHTTVPTRALMSAERPHWAWRHVPTSPPRSSQGRATGDFCVVPNVPPDYDFISTNANPVPVDIISQSEAIFCLQQ